MSKLIYVADDEENIRMLIKSFLENEGYEVRVFSDGAGIRRAFQERVPDLIILDVMMPGEDGLSVCSDLRRNSEGRRDRRRNRCGGDGAGEVSESCRGGTGASLSGRRVPRGVSQGLERV